MFYVVMSRTFEMVGWNERGALEIIWNGMNASEYILPRLKSRV